LSLVVVGGAAAVGSAAQGRATQARPRPSHQDNQYRGRVTIGRMLLHVPTVTDHQ
jgi:hypothetical protein